MFFGAEKKFQKPFCYFNCTCYFCHPFFALPHKLFQPSVQITKKRKQVNSKVAQNKAYSLQEASSLLKDVNTAKFDASVDLHIRLGIDPRKADQALRGVAVLPHGTGKTKRVLVFCNPDKEAEAKDAGADHAGLQEYVEKVEKGWMDLPGDKKYEMLLMESSRKTVKSVSITCFTSVSFKIKSGLLKAEAIKGYTMKLLTGI